MLCCTVSNEIWAFLATSLIVLLLLQPLRSETFSPEKALSWISPQEPSRTTFNLSNNHSQLTILLGDSVILTKASLHQKNQLFFQDFIVDISSPARAGHNLFQQASKYEGMRLTNVNNFISHQSFSNEYKLHGTLEYTRCETLCILEKASLPSSLQHITELESLYGSLQDSYWIHVDQQITKNEYFLSFANSPLFPQNHFSNGSLHLFHFSEDRYRRIDKAMLHGITTYYSYESDSYYNRQYHQLVARMDMLRNVEILIPLSSTAHSTSFSKAACMCVRDLSENLKNSYEAKTLSRRAKFRTLRSPRRIEVQRVKSMSADPKYSNVLSILEHPQFYSPSTFSYLSPSDLHPLRIEDHRRGVARSKRGLPIAAKLSLVLAAKLAQFSLPYALSGQENLLQKLQTEIKGKLLSIPASRLNGSSFKEYLENTFNSGPLSVQLLDDRLSVLYEEKSSALSSLEPPSLTHAKKLYSVSYDLQFVEKELLPNLSSALLHQLIDSLPYPLNPGSPILLKTTTAGTFERHRFWLELYRNDLSYTHFQAKSLPFHNINGAYTSYVVPNSTILDISKQQGGPLQSQACLKHLLADRSTLTSGICPAQVYKAKELDVLFKMEQGLVYNFHGPATLHLECFQHVSSALTLDFEFNVIYLSNSCSASLDKKHQTSAVMASVAIYHEYPYQVIVQVNVPKIASTFEKIYFWLIVLTVSSLFLMCGFLLFYGIFYFVKLRYKPQLSVNSEGIIDISVKHVAKSGLDIPGSVTTILSDQQEAVLQLENKVKQNSRNHNRRSSSEDDLPAVFLHSTEVIPLPLEQERPSARKQKPASH